MTRTTMVRVIAKVLAGRPGLSPSEQAERITDALEAVVEAELESEPSQRVTSVESRTSPDTTLNLVVPAGAIPPSPAVREDRPPRAAQAPTDPPARIVVVPAKTGPAESEAAHPKLVHPQLTQIHRTMEELKRALYAETPETLTIRVPGRRGGQVTLTLERNIIMDVGLGGGGARLVYKHPQAPDGMEAFSVFSCTDPALDLDYALERIERQAVEIYTPRPSRAAAPEILDSPMPDRADPRDIIAEVPIRFE